MIRIPVQFRQEDYGALMECIGAFNSTPLECDAGILEAETHMCISFLAGLIGETYFGTLAFEPADCGPFVLVLGGDGSVACAYRVYKSIDFTRKLADVNRI